MTKLNLGCGHDKRRGYINIDRRPECKPEILADLEREGLKRFSNGTVDEILMRDFLAHLSWRKVRWFLQECHRVLRHGGRMEIRAPDFRAIVDRWLNQTEEWRKWPLATDWEKLSYWIMGAQDYPENTHRSIFTRSELCRTLKGMGFKIERCESDGGTNFTCVAVKG